MATLSFAERTKFPNVRSGEIERATRRCKHLLFLLSNRLEILIHFSLLIQIKDKLATHDSVVSRFAELQQQYDTMQQMYGEKVEETEELQLDLQDVKDMYRAQIDDLLVQQRQLTQQLYTLQEAKPVAK